MGDGGPADTGVGALIRRSSAATPGAPALVWGPRRLTYAEVDRVTAGLARDLRARGPAGGERIGLLGRNSIDYLLQLLAVWRSGHVAVPLNWRSSPVQLRDALASFEASLLLASEEHAGVAAGLVAEGAVAAWRPLEDVGPPGRSGAAGDGAGEAVPDGDRLVAIVSTGGTEGAPKGVMIHDRNLAPCIAAALEVGFVVDGDVAMVLPQMFHNPHFIVLPTLSTGGTLVIPEMRSFDADLVLQAIEDEGVTTFTSVATMLPMLLARLEERAYDTSSLRQVSYGGSPFAPDTLRRAASLLRCDFLQMYGQTETSVLVSVLGPEDHRRALSEPGGERLLGSCGKPVPSMAVRLVDEEGRDVPRDGRTSGEIVVRGASVMSGYWKRPDLTGQVLRDGWCHTGDMACWDEDGYLFIQDRRKEMVVTGGENVFPRAVEDAITSHPGVEAVAVVGIPDQRWGEALHAAVVLRPGADLDAEGLIRHCRGLLAGYMIPRSIEFVDGLPKTPTGKVAKAEIRARFWAAAGRAVGAV